MKVSTIDKNAFFFSKWRIKKTEINKKRKKIKDFECTVYIYILFFIVFIIYNHNSINEKKKK